MKQLCLQAISDIAKGIDIALPENYYPNDDPEQKPLLRWRGAAKAMYSNWINYYVYQITPYSLGQHRLKD